MQMKNGMRGATAAVENTRKESRLSRKEGFVMKNSHSVNT
jgi:hypothetical protein